MEFHINGTEGDISRYVFCPGSQSRARQIADHFTDMRVISEERGIVIYSGSFNGVFMTSCGTGMGGPATAIATEELGHLGADTFIRVGSCGVFQEGQQPGDVVIATGTIRLGGTGLSYLPVEYPAVPTFHVTRALVDAAAALDLPVTLGVGIAGDGFYGVDSRNRFSEFFPGKPVSVEMASDTLFLIGAVRGWRTGAIYTSDGTPEEIKPEWSRELFRKGIDHSIQIALAAVERLAREDAA